MENCSFDFRSVLGSRFFGRGRSGVEVMCATLNLPSPLSNVSFAAHAKCICNVLADMVDSQRKQATRNIKIMLGGELDDVMDVAVTCDCMWSKLGRVHCSMWGASGHFLEK